MKFKRALALLATCALLGGGLYLTPVVLHAEEPVALAEADGNRAANQTVTFKFEYGNKPDQKVSIANGEKIGDRLPSQERFLASFVKDGHSFSAYLIQTGWRVNGEKKTNAEARDIVVTSDMELVADYTADIVYTYTLLDGRDTNKFSRIEDPELRPFEITGPNGKIQSKPWVKLSSKELPWDNGDPGTYLKQTWEAHLEVPLKNADGSFINYKVPNDYDVLKSTPYDTTTITGNEYLRAALGSTNFYQWFYVWVSDATAAKPVTVKVQANRRATSAWESAASGKTYTKNFEITIDNDEHDAFGKYSAATKDSPETTGPSWVWSSLPTFSINNKDHRGDLNDRTGFGTMTLGITAEDLPGYTKVAVGPTDYPAKDNKGKWSTPGFFYFKNLTVTFDANGGEFKNPDGTSTSTVTVPALQTQKLGEKNVPVNPTASNKTFLGWADKNDPNKTIVDLNKTPINDNITYIAVWDEAPVVTVGDIVITEGDEFNPLDWIKIEDAEDGTITPDPSMVTENNVNPKVPGNYTVTYTVTDSHGNKITKTVTVVVKAPVDANNGNDGNSTIIAPAKATVPTTADASASAAFIAEAGLALSAAAALLKKRQ